MMHGWGFGGGGSGGYGHMHGLGGHHRFEEQYHCYSFVVADKSHLERGDKILLPPSAFDTLARLQVDYPMLFQLNNKVESRHTHCGVLEFTAEEGTCYIPFWMMQNLLITEGAVITVTNVSLPKATFVKLQPQSTDFLEISNPRAVLEHALRNYSCVTKGDIIQIPYNSKNYQLELKEVKPQDAACIIETDCNVDFDAPVGYQEPTRESSEKGSNANNTPRSSACPSPTTVSSASSITGDNATQPKEDEKEKISAVKVVNGEIVKNDKFYEQKQASAAQSKMLAQRTGATGIQRNAAIPEMAPEVDYWVMAAGSGARLDGKKPAELKDKEGNVLDEQEIRRQAALRAAQARAATASSASSTTNTSSDGNTAAAAAAPKSKRKTRVGSKFSRLKQSGVAFQGAANHMK